MSEPRRTAYATVEVVLRVETDSWGPDCTMGQIVKQAKEAAVLKVRNMFANGHREPERHGVTIHSLGMVKVRCEEDPR